MIFREVTQGTQLYLLDRLNVTVGQCTVAGVSKPHFDPKMLGNPPSMVVDVTIDVNGVKKSYVFNEGAEFGTVEGILLTPNREVVIRELQSIQGQAKADLKMVDRKKETITKCKSIIGELDPSVKERQAMETRITSLEKTNKELLDKMSELLKAVKTNKA
jgi:hypothetical protein